jgi:chemotaxis protein MotB
MKRKLQSVFERSNLGGQTKVILTDKGVKIELASSAIYSPGSADIREEMRPAISQIADILKNSNIPDYIVIVEGHTDNVPINTVPFPSNWELSSTRATNIVRYLIANGIPNNKLRASGYADTRPVAPNFNEDGQSIQENQAKNRRVEIYIEKPE